MSGTARLRLAGLPITGRADLRAETGSGSTPRNGAGSIATETAASPRPARIWAIKPPKECPISGRLLLELADHGPEVVGHLADRLVGEDLGVPLASSTVLGSSGQPGVRVT